MNNEMIRKRGQAQLRAKRLRSTLTVSGVGLLIIGVIGLVVWTYVRPLAGEEIAHFEDATAHVTEGSDPGPYNSNPPTSGRHYGIPLKAGFYEEDAAEVQLPYPEGYLLHNLEHGYIIFWYNCSFLDALSCYALKSQIKQIFDDQNLNKLIAFPWNEMEDPLALTSWGQILRMDKIDAAEVNDFIRTNRNQAPEPNTL
jgi:hypothetical protein